MDSNDRRMLKTLSNLFVPAAAPSVISFLTGFENDTVEIFAVFEGDETSERSDTCVMKSFTVPNYDGTSMTKQSETKYCRNNQLVISDLDPTASGLLKSMIFSQFVGGMGTNSDLITSFAGDGKINQSETLQLKDMLMGLDQIKEKTSGKSDMSLEEILNLIENPTSVIEDKIEEKIGVIEEEIKEGVEDKIDDVIKESTTTSVTTIPGWVKNNAGWWADGQIPDSAFVQGIQYLIKEGIMVIPSTVQTATADSQEVPGWVKNNAGWWASGEIPDSTFVNGIQYLIKEGIIKVESVSMDDFGKVTRIVDGDTLLIGETKIRLSLVNTPERGEPGFHEATDFTATTCPVGTNAKFIEDSLQPKDRYGRSVGLVYCNDMFLNELLLTNGHAKISTYYCDKSEFGNEDWARDHGC